MVLIQQWNTIKGFTVSKKYVLKKKEKIGFKSHKKAGLINVSTSCYQT